MLPLHYTLRLKLHKTTILIVADPLGPLSDIKTELLRALTARYHNSNKTISTASGPARIPSSEADILLAKPADAHDASKGWRRLKTASDVAGDHMNWPTAQDDVDEDEDADSFHVVTKPDSNAKSTTAKRSNNITPTPSLPTSPREAGLKDGAVLAFKFRGHAVRWGGGDEGVGMEVDEDEEWDVVVPSYEDAGGDIVDGDGDTEGEGTVVGKGDG